MTQHRDLCRSQPTHGRTGGQHAVISPGSERPIHEAAAEDRSTAGPNKVQSQLIAASLEGSFLWTRPLFFPAARAASQGQTNFTSQDSFASWAPASGGGPSSCTRSSFVAAAESIVIVCKPVRYHRLQRSLVNFSDSRVVCAIRRRGAASRQGMPYNARRRQTSTLKLRRARLERAVA